MPLNRRRRLQLTVRLIIAFVALIGQGILVSISAAADDAGAAAHVERTGISLHHAHNEATCVVCRVLSLHGKTQTPEAAPAAVVIAPLAKPWVLARRPEQTTLPSNLSRAPPGNA